MNAYFAASRMSPEEKENILSQHKTLYDGYRTLQPEIKNEQPLYVQDFAKDKGGIVLNNKGEVKKYTNFGINEQVKKTCNECGGMMYEGECSECGWKGEVGAMEEQDDEEQNEPSVFDQIKTGAQQAAQFIMANPELLAMEHEEDGDPQYSRISDPHNPKPHRKTGKFKRHQYDESKEVCDECGGMMYEGECSECGYRGGLEEETGHLDDIYHEEDLNPNAEFDYVKGASNKTNAFHVKEQAEDYINYEDNENDYEDPDNEDDGFEDIETGEELDEQGGNAPDFDISSVTGAYNFKPKGPKKGDGPYIDKAHDMDLDDEEVDDPYDFSTGGPGIGAAYPVYEEMDEDCDECYEKMESAWSEEMDEQDVSGAQGIYGAMKNPYQFHSDGAGKAGPYQHSQYENKQEDEDAYYEKDLDDDELDLDFEKFNPRDKSWEEITAHTGEDEFSHLDEDIKESVVKQKNRIMEMMNRMKVIK
jgi:hypothetical protein